MALVLVGSLLRKTEKGCCLKPDTLPHHAGSVDEWRRRGRQGEEEEEEEVESFFPLGIMTARGDFLRVATRRRMERRRMMR